MGEGGEKVSETEESSEGERARQTAHFLASKAILVAKIKRIRE